MIANRDCSNRSDRVMMYLECYKMLRDGPCGPCWDNLTAKHIKSRSLLEDLNSRS